MTTPRRALAGLLTAAAVVAALAACGESQASDADTLTVYSAQHESLVRTMLEDFTDETGIELEFRDANDSELANQIVQEGDASPADVFLTENSPSIDVVDEAGLLAPLDDATLEQVGRAVPAGVGQLGRVRRPLDRADLQPGGDRRGRAAGLDARPRRPRSGRAGSASPPAARTSRPSSARSSRWRARTPPASG